MGVWVGRMTKACWWGALALSGLACSSDESSPAIFCENLCERVGECGWDAAACDRTCVQQNQALDGIRTDAIDDLSECIASAPCASIDTDLTWSSCWDEATTRITVTEYARRFCREHAAYLFGCGYDYGAAACEQDYALFTDDTLARFAACREVACDEIASCENKAYRGGS